MREPHFDSYYIEQDHPGCAACNEGATWCVVGPDDVALGTSYGRQDDAIDMARELTDAYRAGQHDAFRTVGRRIGPDERRQSAGERREADERRQHPGQWDGRRKGDDGIPF